MDVACQLVCCGGIDPPRHTSSSLSSSSFSSSSSTNTTITTPRRPHPSPIRARRRRNGLVRAVATEPKPTEKGPKVVNGSPRSSPLKPVNGVSTRMEDVSKEIKRVRAQMEENEQVAILMRGLRGQNLSDSQFADENIQLRLVEDRDSKKQIGAGHRVGDLYILEHLHVPPESSFTVASSFRLDNKSSPFYLWHSRLGHLSSERLKLLVQSGHLGNISVNDISECSGCKFAKMSALPFPKSTFVSTSPFQLVHTDLWGPSSVVSKGGFVYYVSFVDDFSRYTWVYLMTHKSDFFQIYQSFHAMIQT